MIPQAFIDDLLSRTDIVEVVEKYVPLKRGGANLSGLCPFHEEKTPSFTVSQQKQFYHCFGCGAHGTAINFMMDHLGLGFVEAVEELAARLGVDVPKDDRPNGNAVTKDKDERFDIMNRAALHYKNRLKHSDRAISYLRNRGIDGKIAAKFFIGFAVDDWQDLSHEFKDYDLAEVLLETGLVNVKDERRYDRFRDRIMFPIRDFRGRVIAFGGRVIDKGEPKYLNSPETPMFQKGREIYGFWESRQGIRRSKKVLVVEGYMDVVALHQGGLDYTVATLGTAVTEFQVSRLLKQTGELIFCFDGDEAGRKAASRALENSLGQIADGNKISFMFLEEGQDPDSFIRDFGKETFELRLQSSVPLSDFLIDELGKRAGDLTSIEGKSSFAKSIIPALEKIKAPLIKQLLVDRASSLSGLSANAIMSQLDSGSFIRGTKDLKPRREPPSREILKPSVLRHVIQMLLTFPDLMRKEDKETLDLIASSPQKDFSEHEINLLRQLLDYVAEGLDRNQIESRMENSEQKVLIQKLSKVAEERYSEADAAKELVKNEYQEAWNRMTELGRIATQRKLLKDKTPAMLSKEDKDLYRSLVAGLKIKE